VKSVRSSRSEHEIDCDEWKEEIVTAREEEEEGEEGEEEEEEEGSWKAGKE